MLAGSDINKQLYFFAEHADILFVVKNRHKEIFDRKKSAAVNAIIKKARDWDGLRIIKI